MPNGAMDNPKTLNLLARTLYDFDEAQRRFRSLAARQSALSGIELTGLLIVATTPDVSPKALAQDLGMTAGAITALVDRLEDSGHIHRVANPLDRRGVRLHLTDAGRRAIVGLSAAYQGVLDEPDILETAAAILEPMARITQVLNDAAHDHSD